MAWFKKQKPEETASGSFDPEAASIKLKAFVAGKSKLISASDIEDDTKLFSSGLLDSLTYVELALFIEREFGTKAPASSGMDSLDSIGAIVGLLASSLPRENHRK
ncbi:MAG TPA: acyl carrier protein [Candidatus Binatia bacterium]|jgi:acyl carrier protein